jgi:hypothetical protein
MEAVAARLTGKNRACPKDAAAGPRYPAQARADLDSEK